MTNRISALARRVACVASASALAACGSDSTSPIGPQDDAALAAQTFAQLADSVTRTGGDAVMSAAYTGIANIVRMGGHVTPITLSIDGTATTFIAAAMTTETTINDCPKGAYCFAPPATYAFHHLIAWDKANPKRIVQLSSTSNDERIGAILDPLPLAIYARMASLIYLDGAGHTFLGISGTQKFDVAKSDTPCPAPTDSAKVGYLRPNGTCTLADHTVQFSGTLEPSPFQLVSNVAKVQHTIAMSAQTVAGTRRAFTVANVACDTACTKPPIDSASTPPVVVKPSGELRGKLAVTVDSVMHLTFTVLNPSTEAAKIVFPSSQKYDFAVVDSTSGKEAWRWSASRTFLAAIVEQSVPAGGTLTFVETWKPAARGRYLAHAWLTSTSHRAEAYAAVVVP
jgi:hypothetical protein